MRIGMIGLTSVALLWGALLSPVAAQTRYYDAPPEYDRRDDGRSGYYWDRRGRPPPPPGYYRERARYRDRHRRCDRGTGGTILGAIAGGLLGNAAAGRGDRGAGSVVGAGVGALAGHAIDRGC